MSAADEIAKLDGLRKNGTLSQKEFDKQKKALLDETAGAAPKKRRLWLKIPIAIIALIFLIGGINSISNRNKSNSSAAGFQVPICDSKQARDLVKKAVENTVDSRQRNYQLLDLTRIQEKSYDTDKLERACSGTAVLNTGEQNIGFRLYPSERKDALLVHVTGG